jgi:hypothetical protein
MDSRRKFKLELGKQYVWWFIFRRSSEPWISLPSDDTYNKTNPSTTRTSWKSVGFAYFPF